MVNSKNSLTAIELFARLDRLRLQTLVSEFAQVHNLAIWLQDLDGATLIDQCAFQQHQRVDQPQLLKGLQVFLLAGRPKQPNHARKEEFQFTSFYQGQIQHVLIPFYTDNIYCASAQLLAITDPEPVLALSRSEATLKDLELQAAAVQDADSNLVGPELRQIAHLFATIVTGFFQSEGEKIRQAKQIRELKSQQMQFREYYQEIAEGIVLTNADFEILNCNPRCLSLLGYGSPDECIGLNLLTDLVPDSHHQDRLQEAILQEGRIEDFPVELAGKDGRLLQVWITGTERPETSPDRALWRFILRSGIAPAEPIRFEAIDLEDTDKSTELALEGLAELEFSDSTQIDFHPLPGPDAADSAARFNALETNLAEYRQVLEHFPQVLFAYDADEKICYWNQTAEKIFGYAFEEIHTRPVADLIPDFSRISVKAEPATNNDANFVDPSGVQIRKKSGALVLMEIQKFPAVLEGQGVHFILAQDKSELERLRNLIEYTSNKLFNLQLVIEDVVLVTDTYGFISEVNSQAPNMFGYLESELLGEKLTEFAAFEYREKVELALQQALKSTDAQRLKTIFVTADEKEIPVVMNLCALRGKGNGVVGLIVLIQDHSKIETLQKKVARLQERLNQITHSTGYGIFRYSFAQNRMLEMNSAGLSVLGFENLDDLNNFPLQQVWIDSSRLDELKKVLVEKKEVTDFETRVAGKDGRTLFLRLNLRYRVISEQEDYCEGSFQEIHPPKLSDIQVQDLEQKLLLLAKNFPGGVAILTVQEKLEPLNDLFCEIFNRTVTEIKKLKPERLIHRSDRERVLGYWRKVLARQEYSDYHEFIGLKKGGQRLLVGCTASLAIQKGQVFGLYIIIQEITREKELEKKMAQSERLETVSSLAAGFAHDFNNLLTEIAGYASVLLMENELNIRQREHVLQIQRLSGWAGKLTQQLLAFQKDIKPVHRPFQLNHLVQEIIVMLRHSFEPFIKIIEDLAPNLKIIKGDSTQLQQVLLNVCINAKEAMPNGGELHIATRNNNIKSDDIKIHPELDSGQYIQLQISDTGVGMTRAVKEKIFEPFFTTKKKGTGLGLYTSYGIIKNHNGIIEVESEPNRGTTLTIFLPAVDEVVPEYRRRIEDIRGGTETIMLIDDEENILDLGTRMLKKYGYKVVPALGARQALKAYEKKKDKIDLVILDIVMQGMDGRECALELAKINPNITILFTSGFRADPAVREILSQLKGDFLQKPFNMQTFLIKVRDILDQQPPISKPDQP